MLKQAFQKMSQLTLMLALAISLIGMSLPVHAKVLGWASQASCEHCACGGNSCCLDAEDSQQSAPVGLPTASQNTFKYQASLLKDATRSWIDRPGVVLQVIFRQSLPSQTPARPAYQRFCAYLI